MAKNCENASMRSSNMGTTSSSSWNVLRAAIDHPKDEMNIIGKDCSLYAIRDNASDTSIIRMSPSDMIHTYVCEC